MSDVGFRAASSNSNCLAYSQNVSSCWWCWRLRPPVNSQTFLLLTLMLLLLLLWVGGWVGYLSFHLSWSNIFCVTLLLFSQFLSRILPSYINQKDCFVHVIYLEYNSSLIVCSRLRSFFVMILPLLWHWARVDVCHAIQRAAQQKKPPQMQQQQQQLLLVRRLHSISAFHLIFKSPNTISLVFALFSEWSQWTRISPGKGRERKGIEGDLMVLCTLTWPVSTTTRKQSICYNLNPELQHMYYSLYDYCYCLHVFSLSKLPLR